MTVMLTICGKVTSQASSLFEESLPLLPLLLEMKTACVHSPLKAYLYYPELGNGAGFKFPFLYRGSNANAMVFKEGPIAWLWLIMRHCTN